MTEPRSRPLTSKAFFLKSTALTLILCLVFQDFLYASPEVPSLADGLLKLAQFSPAVPKITESVAVIEDRYSATGGSAFGGKMRSQKTIYLIQDPHTNPSGQKNISKVVEQLLESESIDHVFVEAGFGDVSLNSLKAAPLSKRELVGKKYLQKGELSGAEYYNLTSETDLTLAG